MVHEENVQHSTIITEVQSGDGLLTCGGSDPKTNKLMCGVGFHLGNLRPQLEEGLPYRKTARSIQWYLSDECSGIGDASS